MLGLCGVLTLRQGHQHFAKTWQIAFYEPLHLVSSEATGVPDETSAIWSRRSHGNSRCESFIAGGNSRA